MSVADEKSLPELLKDENPAYVVDVLGGYVEATLVPTVVAGLDTGVEGFKAVKVLAGNRSGGVRATICGKVSRTGKFSGSIEAM